MNLVVLIGSGAVGKMTVGQELMKITDYRLFHNHMAIEPVIEIFGKYDGAAVARIREVVFEEFMKTDYSGMIFTYMWAFDLPSDWEYIANVAKRFEETGGTVYYVELVADRAVRLERNKTENRLRNKASKRDLVISQDRMIREETKYRLESREGELTFANYMRIDNTYLEPDEVARMIKERFALASPGTKELFARMRLEEVREDELAQVHQMQVESFMPLYEKYHDAGSPAIEPIERIQRRAAVPNRKYYFILKDGARVGVINVGHNDPNEKEVSFISPLFVLPRYQNQGIGYVAIQKAFEMYPEVKTWKLETILQEPANCHLYEKCGFVRVGEEKVVNDAMTLVDYELRLRKPQRIDVNDIDTLNNI